VDGSSTGTSVPWMWRLFLHSKFVQRMSLFMALLRHADRLRGCLLLTVERIHPV
jgi:hypothetical protein